MKTLRAKRRPQPQPELEILVRLGLHLLELAGSAPTQFVTVAQLASWLGRDRETIRRKIRHRLIEAYFDRRFAQYAIPVAEAERVLAQRGLSLPAECATAQTPLALVGGIMTDDPTKKLLPHEQSQLTRLLAKLGAGPVEAAAKAATELAAEEAERRRLEAKREKLVAREARAAEHLGDLRVALDRISGEIDALIASRPGSTQGRVIAGAMRPGTLQVRRAAQRAAETFRNLLAEGGLCKSLCRRAARPLRRRDRRANKPATGGAGIDFVGAISQPRSAAANLVRRKHFGGQNGNGAPHVGR